MAKKLLILRPRWILTCNARDQCLEGHSLVASDQRIVDILPNEEADRKYRDVPVQPLEDHLLMPGLVNCHTHAAMVLFRGLADDLEVSEWLQTCIWPLEQKLMDRAAVGLGSRLAIAEMLLSGTTCFSDMYKHPEVTAAVAAEAGLRAVLGIRLPDNPGYWLETGEPDLALMESILNRHRDKSGIQFSLSMHSPYVAAQSYLNRVRKVQQAFSLPVHAHLYESRWELDDSMQKHRESPLRRLDKAGLVDDRLLAAHMIYCTPEERREFAKRGIHVVHCPKSNLKLASGFCPLVQWQDAGANVALGSDSAASNNNLDMFSEMRFAAMLGKAVSGRSECASAAQVLRMATINGARALGIDGQTGSLETGKYADMIAVRIANLQHQPIYHPASHVIYSLGRDAVDHVWVGASIRVASRRLVNFDVVELSEKIKKTREKIARERVKQTRINRRESWLGRY